MKVLKKCDKDNTLNFKIFDLKKNQKIFYLFNIYFTSYNGNSFVIRKFNWWHSGHTVGELIETRRPFYYFSKKKNKRSLRR